MLIHIATLSSHIYGQEIKVYQDPEQLVYYLPNDIRMYGTSLINDLNWLYGRELNHWTYHSE